MRADSRARWASMPPASARANARVASAPVVGSDRAAAASTCASLGLVPGQRGPLPQSADDQWFRVVASTERNQCQRRPGGGPAGEKVEVLGVLQ